MSNNKSIPDVSSLLGNIAKKQKNGELGSSPLLETRPHSPEPREEKVESTRGNDRERLAQPVDNRIFFAGEACSEHDFSTAHGAYRTGAIAAEAVLASLR